LAVSTASRSEHPAPGRKSSAVVVTEIVAELADETKRTAIVPARLATRLSNPRIGNEW
jgi:hypothetical protein